MILMITKCKDSIHVQRVIILITVIDLTSLTKYFRFSSVTVHDNEMNLSTPFSVRVNLLPGNDCPFTFQE